MMSIIPVITTFLPFVGAAMSYFFRGKRENLKKPFIVGVTVLTSILTWVCIFLCRGKRVMLFDFIDRLSLELCLDDLGCFFAGLVSVLWIFAVFYAFGYMKDEEHRNMFFAFYTAAYGAVLGIAMSANLLTMYFFYEVLTLVTLPLVIQPMTKKAIRAGRKYLYLSLGGSAFAFIGLVLLLCNTGTLDFVPGGQYDAPIGGVELIAYFLTFLGFGVKAAIFPLHVWLPSASVAPTPVTALLHAVAVVKSGVFAIIRMTYFCYGSTAIEGTWAQYAALIITEVTIFYGSSMALKERHFKRRLAYSTVANISYIIFGAMLLTPAGLAAALMHFLFHSLTKFSAFLAAGAVVKGTGREYVFQLAGLGRSMPFTFTVFTVSALSLTGVPLFCCFFSKWNLCTAALSQHSTAAAVGVGVLLLSALLTALYMISICIRAFFSKGDGSLPPDCRRTDVSLSAMLLPISLLIVCAAFFMPQINAYFTSLAASAF